uniref:Zinc transporter 2 n=1 Tax=Rhabditophanes sp. KR3021 TaxID=114890 RepID=A0AC35TUM3_9BILA
MVSWNNSVEARQRLLSETNSVVEENFVDEIHRGNISSSVEQDNCSVDSILIEHCHEGRDTMANKSVEKSLITVALISVIFIVVEFLGGYLSNSLAIMTDAGHMLSDLFSFIISIIAIRVARSKPNFKYSFGYSRAELVGAFSSMLIIWVLTIVLVMLAIKRIIDQDYEVDSYTMIITSCAGVVFNLIMGAVLHFSGTPHSHGGGSLHSHGGSISTVDGLIDAESHLPDPSPHSHIHVSDHKKNINIRAAFIHILGDLVQSVGVLVAALIIWYNPDYRIADPISTFIFSIIVLFTSYPVLREIVKIVMQATPSHINVSKLQEDLLHITGVDSVHDLRLYNLSSTHTIATVHIVPSETSSPSSVQKEAFNILRQKHGLFDITIQIDEKERVLKECELCYDHKPIR